jgi:hypothetical protein
MSNDDLEGDDFALPNKETPGEQMLKIAKALDNVKKTNVKQSQSGSDDESDPRITREMETRDAELAEETWRPAGVLPDPPQRPGWKHRWIRASSRGELDKVNMARAMQENWRPCAASDYPEIVSQLAGEDRGRDLIEFGGLVLCRMTDKMAKSRNAYFDNIAKGQINAVNQRLAQEEGEGPIKFLNQSSSRSFGGGRRK